MTWLLSFLVLACCVLAKDIKKPSWTTRFTDSRRGMIDDPICPAILVKSRRGVPQERCTTFCMRTFYSRKDWWSSKKATRVEWLFCMCALLFPALIVILGISFEANYKYTVRVSPRVAHRAHAVSFKGDRFVSY